VLPRLPIGALAVTAWDDKSLTLQLEQFVDKELFDALRTASAHAYKPIGYWSFDHKASMGFAFQVVADERIVRALCALATQGSTYSPGVKHLKVHALTVTAYCDSEVAHFADDKGQVWLGVKFQSARMQDWDTTRDPWPLAVTERGIYVAFEGESFFRSALGEPSSRVLFLGAFPAPFVHQPSRVVAMARVLHVEDWLREWAQSLLSAADCSRKESFGSGRRGWRADDYVHPADLLLGHFIFYPNPDATHGGDLSELLGWEREFVERERERIAQLRQAAADAAIARDRARAAELARPRLADMTKDELVAIAARHGVAVKKSAKKDEMVAALGASQSACEDVIGLTAFERKQVEQAQRAAEARTTAVAAEEQARVAREQAAARERADEELVEQIVAGFPQSVTAEIADRLGDLLAQDIETDLACSGAYSGVLDLAYGGKFWDLLERIQQITGRDLEAEARGQQ